MNFNEYQEFTRTTAIYPREVALDYLTHGISEEAGEVAGKRKKALRDNWTHAEYAALTLPELGDVLWYVARLADELGFTLQDIAQMNVNKLSSRKDRGVLQGSGDTR